MKKVFLGILSLFLVSSSLVAQEDADKLFKKAARAYSAFNLDPASNEAKLEEAKSMIVEAMKSEELAGQAKAWQTKGDIYSTSVSQDLAKRIVTPDHPVTDIDGALLANEAYLMAAKKAVKKFETKDAMTGLQANIGNLSRIGIMNYQDGEQGEALKNFMAVLDAHKALKEGGSESPLDDKEEYNNSLYLIALSAMNSDDLPTAAKYFDELAANEYNDAAVYDGIYKTNIDTNPEKALDALRKGRELFPDETSLLFTEINYYLKEGKLDVLTDKLKTAIEQEPDNVSLYSTLGNVYDNLFQNADKDGDKVKGQEYFDLALNYYEQALAKDPAFSDATYSIGALYYNKAAAKTQEMDKITGFSKSELAASAALQEEVFALFDQALPYFQEVEKGNPNDTNTLIALKEIYAKKSDFTLSKEFKTRLEVVQDGGQNETAYFK